MYMKLFEINGVIWEVKGNKRLMRKLIATKNIQRDFKIRSSQCVSYFRDARHEIM